MNELALFAGAGGGILGGKLLGWRTVCAVEWGAYAASVLVARQNDGSLPPFPIWDDIQTFDGRPWRGRVDVVSGGFPCQDISAAGAGAGIDGARSGMWRHMARIVGEVGPRFVLVENSPMLVGRGLARVLGDIASMGYDARWGVVGAVHAGAPHIRERIWILGRANSDRQSALTVNGEASRVPRMASDSELFDGSLSLSAGCGSGIGRNSAGGRLKEDAPIAGFPCSVRPNSNADMQHGERRDHCSAQGGGKSDEGSDGLLGHGEFWRKVEQPEPLLSRMDHGLANRVDRIRAIGNGQVPAVVPIAWHLLGGPR